MIVLCECVWTVVGKGGRKDFLNLLVIHNKTIFNQMFFMSDLSALQSIYILSKEKHQFSSYNKEICI